MSILTRNTKRKIKNFLNNIFQNKRKERIKRVFKSKIRYFFEGEGTFPQICSSNVSILSIGFTNLEFKIKLKEVVEITITATVEKPGLLIGKGGKTIDELETFLSNNGKTLVKVLIKESKLWQ